MQQRLERIEQEWREQLAALDLPEPRDAEFDRQRRIVWEASDYAARQWLRKPAEMLGLWQEGLLQAATGPGDLAARAEAALAEVQDEEQLAAILRGFRHRELVRIVWRDLTRLASLGETLEDLSELADLCIDRSHRMLQAWAEAKWGTPRSADGAPQHMLILAMGKLGARELNLSSDIDLIFAYPAAGDTDGERPTSNEEFFTRLARRLAQILSQQTEDGFVYRVDLRLRPFGDAGALVWTLDALEHYYQSQAREWERYAMVKVRTIGAEAMAERELMDILRPFVYRRYLDYGAIEAIRDMKSKIQAEMHKRGMDANIKLGRGGIREIEFIGQVFQLARGGRDKGLRIRPILQVLAHLGRTRLMPEQAVTELSQAYEFLRLTENRLQAWRDEQTHLLPAEPEARLRLARSMGFGDWPAFAAELEAHRQRVHHHFLQVFAAPEDNEKKDTAAAGTSAEFADPEAARERIAVFRAHPACMAISGRARDKLERLLPLIKRAALASDQPDLVLERMLSLIEAIVRRTSYIDLLLENPVALEHLAKLLAGSPWLLSQLKRHPLLLDELIDPRRLYSPLRRSELDSELAGMLASIGEDDLEQQMEALRHFADSNRLRVAAADLAGALPLMVVSDYLSEIAEVTLEHALRLDWQQMEQRHGHPGEIEGGGNGFLVVAYGKLGGIELGYGSDLDLVFVHGSSSATAMTSGPKSIANELFYARLGQRLIHLLTTRTGSGVLFEIDMRLRPNGDSGLLVTSFAALERYQREKAWTWEHQALARARPIAGDSFLQDRFRRLREEILTRERDPAVLRREVVEMRDKMRAALDRSSADGFDVKQGEGGVADIEFMVQYAVLRWSGRHRPLLGNTGTIPLLRVLADCGLMVRQRADDLVSAYLAYRGALHRNALQEQQGLVAADVLSAEREAVRAAWTEMMTDGAP